MPHMFEPASSGRSKCRGCGRPISKGELRFGESVPNLFAEGDTTLWFHPACAAYKRAQPLLEALDQTTNNVPDRDTLERIARNSVAHERLQRIDGGERSPTGQAKCRSCHEPIEKGSWRIRVVFYDEGRFAPGGFVHLKCAKDYFGTDAILEHVLHFSPTLSDPDRSELSRELAA
jgi:Poly(ADP-ribose) polymerase and DNA-Ligase Zn-finger region